MKEFPEIKKRLAFGLMRLPMVGEEVDIPQVKDMVDLFLKNGFNYFDTAHGYIRGLSEKAVKECLSSRYPRESYLLTNKLTGNFFNKEEDIIPLFNAQLEACGVPYFDFYLMHAQNRLVFQHFKKCHAYETALKLLEEGKIRHFGISFHDTADVLEQILQEYPQIEVVQIQYNYLDYDDVSIQSKKCYDVCVKYDKRVLIMEPIKGGSLINLPEKGQQLLKEKQLSPANLALRFAATPKNVLMVLSGMSAFNQMEENISIMKDFQPLNEDEFHLCEQIAATIRDTNMINCTACRYCVDGCPKHISIPDLFACMNSRRIFHDWNAGYYYHNVHTANKGKASECIKCGRCENICPQHLPIRQLLEEVAQEFEK